MLLCRVILAHRIFTASGNADLLIGVRSAAVVRPTSAFSPSPGLPPFLDVQTFRRSSAPRPQTQFLCFQSFAHSFALGGGGGPPALFVALRAKSVSQLFCNQPLPYSFSKTAGVSPTPQFPFWNSPAKLNPSVPALHYSFLAGRNDCREPSQKAPEPLPNVPEAEQDALPGRRRRNRRGVQD
jgi:hypothetical protein